MTATRTAEEQHPRDVATLRRAKDRTDREYAQPADVDALARGVNMSSRAQIVLSVEGAPSRSAGAPIAHLTRPLLACK